jgi:hypothetical protein
MNQSINQNPSPEMRSLPSSRTIHSPLPLFCDSPIIAVADQLFFKKKVQKNEITKQQNIGTTTIIVPSSISHLIHLNTESSIHDDAI